MTNQNSKYQFEVKLLNEVEKTIQNILVEKKDLPEIMETLMSLSEQIVNFKRSNTNINQQCIEVRRHHSDHHLLYPDFML
jgi:hypothetical protein